MLNAHKGLSQHRCTYPKSSKALLRILFNAIFWCFGAPVKAEDLVRLQKEVT